MNKYMSVWDGEKYAVSLITSINKRKKQCGECLYIGLYKEKEGFNKLRAFYGCDDGKRKVRKTDNACMHFKCHCCETSRLGKGGHWN